MPFCRTRLGFALVSLGRSMVIFSVFKMTKKYKMRFDRLRRNELPIVTSIRRLLVLLGSSSLGWSIVDARGDIDSLLASCANILSSSFVDNQQKMDYHTFPETEKQMLCFFLTIVITLIHEHGILTFCTYGTGMEPFWPREFLAVHHCSSSFVKTSRISPFLNGRSSGS